MHNECLMTLAMGATRVKSPHTTMKDPFKLERIYKQMEDDSDILREFLQHGQWTSYDKNRSKIGIPTEARIQSALDNIGGYRQGDWMILDKGIAPVDPPPQPKASEPKPKKKRDYKNRPSPTRDKIMKNIKKINYMRKRRHTWAYIAREIGVPETSLYDVTRMVKSGEIKSKLRLKAGPD